MKLCGKMGFALIVLSGIIYSLERGFSMIATSIVKAGFFAGNMTGQVPDVVANGFFSNMYAPAFLIVGIGLIIYSLIKK